MNDFSSIKLEWVYTPEDYFREEVTVPFEGGSITISNGKILAEIGISTFKPASLVRDDQTEEISEELDAEIYAQVKQIEEILENLFHAEHKKNQNPYQFSLLFKILVREDGREIVLHA